MSETENLAKIDELDRLTEGRLPRDYLEFLAHSDLNETDIPIMPYLFIPSSAAEVIDGINGLRYEVLPGLITIGTSGGGELIVLDMQKQPPWVASIHAIHTESDSLYLLGHSFSEFSALLGKEPDSETLDVIKRHMEIPLAASSALDAIFWTKEQIPAKVKELELDRYAPEFDPIARSGCSNFIGIRKDDGSVWRVPCLGTEHLKADKMADSLLQLHQFMTELNELNKLDEWRYYTL